MLDFALHLLSESTLLDNYNAIHLVNNVKRLDKASFIKSLVTNTVKASIILLPILGRGTRTFKGLLNRIKGKKVDLILFDIIIIKGFLINIVLKALLYKKGL
jgi:hypothetical protein